MKSVRLTLIDGPTLLIEIANLRLLTDPTFDPPQEYGSGNVKYSKLNPSPVKPDSLLPIDAILLSHDQHMDNLDHAGRAFLPHAKRVLTTTGGAQRLGGSATALEPWTSTAISTADGQSLTIAGVPGRHGPVGVEPITGEVIGFVLSLPGHRDIYISGDTVWFDGLNEVARRFDVGLAILFTGSAQPRGPFNVTMNSNDAIEAAHRFSEAKIVAVHNSGWSHYVQSQEDLRQSFEVLGIDRLLTLEPVVPLDILV